MYRIFTSEDRDWYVVAKAGESDPQVLYEGHHHELALEAILDDLGIQVPIIEKDMESGTYVPTRQDF